MNHLLRLALLVICVCFVGAAFAQNAGSLDPTFGNGGTVDTSLYGSQLNTSNSMAIQSDGKIVIVGYTNNGYNVIKPALIRFNVNGSLDTSFNKIGYTSYPTILNGYIVLTSIAIQTNGKILGLGVSIVSTTNLTMIRYNTNGTLDTTFSDKGIDILSFGRIDSQRPFISLQPDGKIVTGFNYPDGAFGLARFDTSGELDTTFGSEGIVHSFKGTLESLAVQNDEKILAVGHYFNNFQRMVLARYNTNGSLDTIFGTDGIDTPEIINYFISSAYCLALQPDGKIVVGGAVNNNIGTQASYFTVTRFNSNGSFDTSFGTKGLAIFSNYGTATSLTNGGANSILIQPDGKIVAVGANNTNPSSINDNEIAMVRFNTNGTPDSTFGVNGEESTSIIGTDDYANSVALEPDGKIVVSCYAYDSLINKSYFAAARFISGLVLGIIQLSATPTSILTYPNPVHNTETLDYTLTNDETLSINLYDVTGRVIRNYMTNETMLKGEHKQQLNFENIAAGSYILTISNGDGKMESVKIIRQ